MIGGQEAAYIGWADLDEGAYVIQETVPDGYFDPIVICEGNIPGIQNDRANIIELPAPGGTVQYDLTEDVTLTCETTGSSTPTRPPSTAPIRTTMTRTAMEWSTGTR